MAIELELIKPIGSFILENKDIVPVMTKSGAYYHYKDVCTLLNRLKDMEQQSLTVVADAEN